MIDIGTWEEFLRFGNRSGWAWNNLLGQNIDHPYLGVATPQQFGALANGIADDTTAMQSAHATGKIVYYPAGTYKFSTITLAAGGIIGDGQNLTILSTTDATSAEVIKFNGAGQVSYNGTSAGPVFEGFKITTTATKTGGGLITLEPSSGEISFARFTGVAFAGGWDQIKTVAASHWRVHNCTFINYAQSGIRVQNTNNNDSGDSTVTGCLFNCGVVGEATQTGILQLSSAGLKVIGCKFLGGAYGYLMLAVLSSNCAGFYFVGNSVENQSSAGLQFNRTSGAFGWGGIIIGDNEFALVPLHVVMNDSTGFISDVIISGNNFAQLVSTDIAISLDYLTGFTVQGNRFSGSAGSNGGISVGSSALSGHIGVNTFRSVTNRIVNGSTSAVVASERVLLDSDTASNSASITLTWTDTVFTRYEVEWHAAIPATNGAVILMNRSTNGGSSLVAGTDHFMCMAVSDAGTEENTGNATDGAYRIGGTGATGIASGASGSSGKLRSSDMNMTRCWSEQVFEAAASVFWTARSGHYSTAGGTINAVKFIMNSGNISSGTFFVYGIRN